MKLKHFLTVICLLIMGSGYAQLNILNAEHPDEIGTESAKVRKQDNTDKPLPYGYISKRDVMWGKSVWEYIDVGQKFNFPYLYPVDTGRTGRNRLSLYYVLVKNIKNGKIKHVYSDSYFTHEISFDELTATLHQTDTLPAGRAQLNAGDPLDPQYVTHTDVNGSDVMGFRIRGYWYFDNRLGELRYRLLGICPMVIGAHSKKLGLANPTPVALFWVFYPEVRNILFHAKVFNRDNAAHPMNFDQLLNSRRFHATIYKYANVHGDRAIEDYLPNNALNQLLEARRIENEIRDFEVNMWNY